MASLQAPRQQCRAAPPAAAVRCGGFSSPSSLFLMTDFLIEEWDPCVWLF